MRADARPPCGAMAKRRDTLAAASAGADRWMGACLGLSGALLLAGLWLPALTVSAFFHSEQYSLAGAVFGFAAAGDWFLFGLTFLFTVLLPLAKVAACLALWFAAPRGAGARLADGLAALSRWSMVDVFIVALVVLVVDGQLLTSADIHAGIVVFTAGVLLSGWAARRVARLAAAAR